MHRYMTNGFLTCRQASQGRRCTAASYKTDKIRIKSELILALILRLYGCTESFNVVSADNITGI